MTPVRWLLTALVAVMLLGGCGESASERAARRAREQLDADYARHALGTSCEQARSGGTGFTENGRTPKGVPYTVVTPANYVPQRAHPLLVVFAPAGISRFAVERVTAFTAPATRAGFVVVYAEHPPLGLETTRDLGQVARQVAQHWCIDTARVYFAGHSDGGTVAHMLSALPDTRGMARGIAPSGAGVRAPDLSAHGCPPPLAVMVSHGTGDKTFPGWGEETARWWAACNRCAATTRPLANGCVEFQSCDARGPTRYCATPGGHARWPGNAEAIVAFFSELPTR